MDHFCLNSSRKNLNHLFSRSVDSGLQGILKPSVSKGGPKGPRRVPESPGDLKRSGSKVLPKNTDAQ